MSDKHSVQYKNVGHHDKDWPEKVLAACRKIPNIVYAAKSAGVSRNTIYDRKQADPVFAEQLADALATGVEACEAEVHRRAFQGMDVPKSIAGERELVREYSDTLAIFLLKAHCPEKYREKQDLNLHGTVGIDHSALIAAAHNGGFHRPEPQADAPEDDNAEGQA